LISSGELPARFPCRGSSIFASGLLPTSTPHHKLVLLPAANHVSQGDCQSAIKWGSHIGAKGRRYWHEDRAEKRPGGACRLSVPILSNSQVAFAYRERQSLCPALAAIHYGIVPPSSSSM
jgi:hypothetical protein